MKVKRSGLVANHPGRWAGSQISMTHPDMFPFFHLNREEDYKAKTTLIQSMAGLILIDVNNAKMIGMNHVIPHVCVTSVSIVYAHYHRFLFFSLG